jgi:LPXTG-site transpeptidase (sortase) family protein
MKRKKVKKVNKIWINVAQVGLLLVVVVLVMNWGYFSKQVSAWWLYDVMDKNPAEDVAPDVISGQADRLAIPDLELNVPLVYVNSTDEVTFQHALESGVVHYPSTALPGEFGNAYYFGHSSDYAFKKGNFKTVFAILPKIEIGAKVYVTNAVGKQFVYTVTEKKIVSPQDVSVLSQEGSTKKLLSLQASWPLGTALKRYIVVCEMQ